MNISEKLKAVIRDVDDFPIPGIVFKDITPILHEPVLCHEVLNDFVKNFNSPKPDAIVSIESRGFMWGMMLAQHFQVPFVPVRKAGKLPYKTIKETYALEYGQAVMEIHEDAIVKGWNVLIHDDLLATGGTAAAAANLVKKSGGEVLGFGFVIELSFLGGQKKLKNYGGKIHSIISY